MKIFQCLTIGFCCLCAGICLLSYSVCVAEDSVNTNTPQTDIGEPIFKEELLNAVEHCDFFHEDFTSQSTSLQKMFDNNFENIDFVASLDVWGLQNDLCRMLVQYGHTEPDNMYDCLLNTEQRKELVDALKDPNQQPITETFISSQQKITDENGNVKVVSTQNTLTGKKMMVKLLKMRQLGCQMKVFPLSAEEQTEIHVRARMLPQDFVASLLNCKPQTAKYHKFFNEENIEITGWNEDRCHLVYKHFDLYVPQNMLANLQTFDDIEDLIVNQDVAQYNSSKGYRYDGVLFALAACAQSPQLRTRRIVNIDYGHNTEVISGWNSAFYEDSCRLELENVLRMQDNVTDYGIVCNISEDELETMIEPYVSLLEKENQEQKSTNQEDADDDFEDVKETDDKIDWQNMETTEQTKQFDLQLIDILRANEYCRLKNLSAEIIEE
ncbi:MAG: hypothetical protein IJ218_00175 [Alphaproteobacteria bacterium]|nr:hypothetical protein [Alphaproteobacteria bacterium]